MRRAVASVNDAELSQAYAAARTTCRRGSREWFSASIFLPSAKRQGVYAAMAFCRLIAQSLAEPAEAGAVRLRHHPVGPAACRGGGKDEWLLRSLRERLEQLYARRLELPAANLRSEAQHVMLALADTVQRYEIPPALFVEFAEACLAGRGAWRYATWNSLLRQLERSSGSIARIIGSIVGVTHSEAPAALVQLAQGAQLTRLLRSMRADAQQGRIYLPLAELARCRYSERELLSGTRSQNLSMLIRATALRARQLCRGGTEGIGWLAGDGSRLAAATLLVQTLALLERIERQPERLMSGSVTIGAADTLRRLADAWKLALRQPGEPLPRALVRRLRTEDQMR